MSKLFITSDTHFGHKNIIAYCSRPFLSVTHMDETLIKNWNSVVEADDMVVHVGDFGFGSVSYLANIRKQLNGKILLVLGNHDKNISSKKWQEIIGIEEVQKTPLHFKFVDIWHYPYVGDSVSFDRYQSLRLPMVDKWLLHGHVHDAWRIKGKQFNVGVDVNGFKPLLFEDVINEISAQ